MQNIFPRKTSTVTHERDILDDNGQYQQQRQQQQQQQQSTCHEFSTNEVGPTVTMYEEPNDTIRLGMPTIQQYHDFEVSFLFHTLDCI